MRWLIIGTAVCLLLVGCKMLHNQAKENHIKYYEQMGCPCECIN
jgi:hypothetical protein